MQGKKTPARCLRRPFTVRKIITLTCREGSAHARKSLKNFAAFPQAPVPPSSIGAPQGDFSRLF